MSIDSALEAVAGKIEDQIADATEKLEQVTKNIINLQAELERQKAMQQQLTGAKAALSQLNEFVGQYTNPTSLPDGMEGE